MAPRGTVGVLLLSFLLIVALVHSFDTNNQTSSTLRAVLVLTRHGDRTPVRLFPNTRSLWPEGLGQLTPLGMKQHYLLGQHFRERYIKQHKLIGEYYNVHDVYALSTSKERTLMSAQSFMHGLFPPGFGPDDALPTNMQLVPIHAADTHEDTILLGYKNCPYIKQLTNEYRMSREWQEMEEETAELRENLSQIFGSIIRLKDMHSVYSLLKCEKIHGRESLPLSLEVQDAINKTAHWMFYKKFTPPGVGRLGGGNLLIKIASILDSQINPMIKDEVKQKGPKFTLFSAHDGTILSLLAAMEAEDYSLPDYADYIHFELFEEGSGHWVVKIWYKDKPFSLPQCPHTCSLEQFKQWANSLYYADWNERCGRDQCPPMMLTTTEGHAQLVAIKWELVVIGVITSTSVVLVVAYIRSKLLLRRKDVESYKKTDKRKRKKKKPTVSISRQSGNESGTETPRQS